MFKIKNRVIKEALYIIENNATVREAAKSFNISKSTVHKDITERLEKINKNLYKQIKTIMSNHLKTRHIKGGEITKNKYKSLRT